MKEADAPNNSHEIAIVDGGPEMLPKSSTDDLSMTSRLSMAGKEQ